MTGAWKGHYMGDYELTDADLDSMVANFEREGRDILFDFDHECFSGSSRAAGWGKSLEFKDGKLHADVEWTKAGLEAIENKEFRYLSNVFIFNYENPNNPALRGTYLHSVALTNVPFQKELPEILANSLKIQNATGGEHTMNELLKLLGAKSEAEAIIKVNSMQVELDKANQDKIDAIAQKEALELSNAELTANNEQLKAENATLNSAAVETEVDLAIANGLAPAYRETAIFLRNSNKAEYDKFIANAVKVPTGNLKIHKNTESDNADYSDAIVIEKA
jgi:phage I-like protein